MRIKTIFRLFLNIFYGNAVIPWASGRLSHSGNRDGRKAGCNEQYQISQVCTITEIGMDHMQYLGNTIEEIAGEKAGIIKEHIPVVYCDRRTESSGVIEKEQCRSMHSHFTQYQVHRFLELHFPHLLKRELNALIFRIIPAMISMLICGCPRQQNIK